MNNHSIRLAACALLLTFVSGHAAETYQIDPVHSTVGFKIKHLISKVGGRFADVSGTITGDPAAPEETKVNVVIKATSIDTGDAKRDEHLRSAEFFDVAQFPTITFQGKRVNRTGEDSAFVIGDLNLHGVTREAILEVKFLGRGKDMKGLYRTGWEVETKIKRSDYGLTWSKAIEGTQVIGDDVEIAMNIEAVQETPAPAAAEPSKETTSTAPAQPAPTTSITAPMPPTAAPAAEASAPRTVAPESLPLVFQPREQPTAPTAPAAPEPPARTPAPAPEPAPTATQPPTPPAPAAPSDAPAAAAPSAIPSPVQTPPAPSTPAQPAPAVN